MGRTYEAIVRITTQSVKSGVAYVMRCLVRHAAAEDPKGLRCRGPVESGTARQRSYRPAGPGVVREGVTSPPKGPVGVPLTSPEAGGSPRHLIESSTSTVRGGADARSPSAQTSPPGASTSHRGTRARCRADPAGARRPWCTPTVP
ncbi:hypothetical protein [Streptosporangium vulgare]|uniref:hypothetical protein n=1 Tax=Streptosporangium vulgare TaxID=46190 RepID=UPI003CD0746B